MKKLLGAITIAAMLLIGGVTANANPNVAHLAGQGPNDGEFSAWTKQMANGEQIKFYAKYLQPGQKVQFMVQNSAGSYVQYAWKRVETEDLNPDGSYSNMQNHIYFIRTLDLKPGKNRVRILVDGEIVWGTKTYSIKEAETIAPAWVQSASPADVEECKLIDPRSRSEQLLYRGQRDGEYLGKDPIGFTDWRRPGLLPTTGELNTIFVRVAFDDAPPSSTVPDGYLEAQAQKMTELGHHWTEGQFTYEFQIVEDWIQVPVNHRDYPISSGNDVDHSADAYAKASENMKIVSQLVIDNLPNTIDFTSADLVVPVWSTNITAFTMPVTWRGGGLTTPDGKDTDLIFMGNSTYMHDNLEYTWSQVAHDFLHLQGLNLHAPGPLFGTHIGGMVKPNYWGWSALMSTWETFLLGWIDDSKVHCIESTQLNETEQVILTSQEVLGGDRRMLVVPVSQQRALVVESRRPIGYSASWPSSNSGVLVYEIDTVRDHEDHGADPCSNSRNNLKWGFYLLPDGADEADRCNNPAPYFMKPGQTLTYSGVKFELVHSAESADYITVSSANHAALAPTGDGNPGNEHLTTNFDESIALTRKGLLNSQCGCCGCTFLGGVQ